MKKNIERLIEIMDEDRKGQDELLNYLLNCGQPFRNKGKNRNERFIEFLKRDHKDLAIELFEEFIQAESGDE